MELIRCNYCETEHSPTGNPWWKVEYVGDVVVTHTGNHWPYNDTHFCSWECMGKYAALQLEKRGA